MFNSAEGRGLTMRRLEPQWRELGAGHGITAVLAAKRWQLGASGGSPEQGSRACACALVGGARGWACVRRGQIRGGPDWSSLLPLHPLCPSWAVWAGQPFWEELCYGCGLYTSAGSGSWGRTLRRRDWSLAVALPLPGEWEFRTTGR